MADVFKTTSFSKASRYSSLPALTDQQLANLIYRTGHSPFHLSAELLRQIPFKNLMGLTEVCFSRFEEKKNLPTNFQYTKDPFNMDYSPAHSWVMPVHEGYDFAFRTKTPSRHFATDLAGVYAALEKYLTFIPVPWVRPIYRSNTAVTHRLDRSKDFEIVYTSDRIWSAWLIYFFNRTFWAYRLTVDPYKWKQKLTSSHNLRNPKLVMQLKKYKEDFCCVLYSRSLDPYSEKLTFEVGDVFYYQGRDYSRHKWSARKHLPALLAADLELRPVMPTKAEYLPGKGRLYRHEDAKPFTYSYACSWAPPMRWMNFILSTFEQEGEQANVVLSLREDGKDIPFARAVLPMKVFHKHWFRSERNQFAPGQVVRVLADTLTPERREMKIYRIRRTPGAAENCTFKSLMEA